LDEPMPEGWRSMPSNILIVLIVLYPLVLVLGLYPWIHEGAGTLYIPAMFILLLGPLAFWGVRDYQRSKGSIGRTFRLPAYDQLPYLERNNRFRQDLEADPMSAVRLDRGYSIALLGMREQYTFEGHEGAFMSLVVFNSSAYEVAFNLSPKARGYVGHVERFCRSKGWVDELEGL
jgi:hypothetical protein